tara:strand:+ start:214 stop:510 length:297 start_codon:yes stop_codon:yes gene_type:complete
MLRVVPVREATFADEVNYLYEIYDANHDMALSMEEVVQAVVGDQTNGKWKSKHIDETTGSEDLEAVVTHLVSKFGAIVTREQFQGTVLAALRASLRRQ